MAGELRGIGVGSRAAMGHVLRIGSEQVSLETRHSSSTPAQEKDLLSAGIESALSQIRQETSSTEETTQAIMTALLSILEDPELIELATPALEEGFDAATALVRAIDSFAELMGDDEDFMSRAGDLRAITVRMGHIFRGTDTKISIPEEGQWIIVASDLTPLETSQFGASVVGVVTELGGPTSHTAIICRALGIPAVVSCAGASTLGDGVSVLVDPVGNRVVENGGMSDATASISFVPLSDSPLITVRANIGSLQDARAARDTEARGVGLFRTEVLYLDTLEPPSVEVQAAHFAEIFSAAPAGKIIVRTIDAGSDKPVPFLSLKAEENPALGVRGFRMVSHFAEFFQSQLEAISLAISQTGRDVGVMAPMVATSDEVDLFREMCERAGITQVGIMVEAPAIISLIGELRGSVDFLSIGTNDLSQYLFAADRLHPELGYLSSPWQPGLLRQVHQISLAAQEIGVPVGVCGESAADPLLAVVFAGMGIGSVSVAPSSVNEVRSALSSVTAETAKLCAEAALSARSESEARTRVKEAFIP
jgi:phosphotransferase system enzyme I (PtsI)